MSVAVEVPTDGDRKERRGPRCLRAADGPAGLPVRTSGVEDVRPVCWVWIVVQNQVQVQAGTWVVSLSRTTRRNK